MNSASFKKYLKKPCGTAVFIGGCSIGFLLFIAIYGVRVLDFTYDAWLLQGAGSAFGMGDLTQHYMGWLYLRESHWSFPLGLIENLNYPDRISIIYTDSIPIFALFFKALSPLLPETFQYFGLWGASCFALQGGFSALILRKYSDNLFLCLAGSVFFITSPIMLKRIFFHSALAAHWVLLAALCIWIYKEKFTSLKRNILAWGSLGVFTVLSNLYFTPMVFGILLCYLADYIIREKKALLPAVTLASSSAVTALFMFLTGTFYGNVSAKSGGLGVFSFNLNGFVEPQGNSALMKSHFLANSGQNEGFAYLGFGMLAILIAAFLVTLSETDFRSLTLRKIGAFLLEKTPLLLALSVFTILALSPVVTLNDRMLFTIPYPQFISDILAVFRSSGRFIWTVYYMIFIWGISKIISLPKKSAAGIFLCACLFLQLFDIKSMLRERREVFSAEMTYASRLQSPAWEELARTRRHIMFGVPLWDVYVSPDAGYQLGIFALSHGMTVNGVYFARDLSPQVDAKTAVRYAQLKAGIIPDDTVYVFLSEERLPRDIGLNFYLIDGYYVGLIGKIKHADILPA